VFANTLQQPFGFWASATSDFGNFLPGTRLPIHSPDKIRETKPDYLFLLPWNLKDEIIGQLAHVRGWGGRFVIAAPHVQVLD